MKDASDKHVHRPRTELPIVQLLPNLLTIIAICAGLTAIRFGFEGNYERAVLLILAAGILDGLDGKLARVLKSDSKMGAELDSLADFVNFGVAPPLVIYFWALQDMRSAGWISVLVFAVCCVLRLARFNVSNKSDHEDDTHGYYIGVPSPAGAGLVMLPMFATFAFADQPVVPAGLVSFYMMGIGLLLISRIPTWSFKAMTISREHVKFLIVLAIFIVAAVLTYAWITLVALSLFYVCIVSWTLLAGKAPRLQKKSDTPD
jgi:CDP-diacylglycerol--serine O-phosphatidyltransferase